MTNEISNEGGGNIIDIIEFFVQPLVYNMKEFTYILKIEMVNYFTFKKERKMLQESMLILVGTKRFFPS